MSREIEHEANMREIWGEHEGYDSIFEKIILVICTVWFFIQCFFVQLWIYTVVFERQKKAPRRVQGYGLGGLCVGISVCFNGEPHSAPLNHDRVIHSEGRLRGFSKLAVCHTLVILRPFAE